MTALDEPVRVQVTRWRCPHCGRSHSGRTRAQAHMARCWRNPAARSCKTCAHFQPAIDDCPGTPGCGCGNDEFCHQDLDVQIAVETRPGTFTFPINCPLWSARPDMQAGP